MGSGDAYYELEGSHQRRFHIKAFVHPRRAPYGARHVVEVVHTQLPTRDVRKGDTVRLRFPGPGVRGRTMQWGLVGSEADGMWSSYNPPLTWMQRSLHVIGDRKLKHVCMPGSHNAGMSRISGQSFFATPGNTQNQILDIYQQLMRGSRWLDIRPCLGNGGKVMLCHYSVRFGGNGVSVDDAVNQINRFMRDFPGELVILDVNADSAYDTDNNYARLSPVQWNSILPKFNKIQRPCIVKGSLADATMSSLIGDGQGCVAVVKRSPVQQIENRPHGIYSQDSLPHFNVWSDTPNHEQMALDQIRKLQTNRAIGDELDPNTRDQFHVLSWFITPPPMSLRRRWRQPQLVNVAAETLSTLSSFGMREFSPYAFPNVLYVDGFGMPNGAVVAGTRMSRKEKFEASGAHMVALAMAVNYAIVSRNCYVGGLQLE